MIYYSYKSTTHSINNHWLQILCLVHVCYIYMYM